jgi:hypothetical protein
MTLGYVFRSRIRSVTSLVCGHGRFHVRSRTQTEGCSGCEPGLFATCVVPSTVIVISLQAQNSLKRENERILL